MLILLNKNMILFTLVLYYIVLVFIHFYGKYKYFNIFPTSNFLQELYE